MKNQGLLGIAGAVLMGVLGVNHVSGAEASPSPDLAASEARFHAVASHLDLGGDFYFYLNLESLVARGVQRVKTMIEPFAEEEMVALVGEKLTMADELLRDSGIYNIASVGMSSKPVEGGLSRSKTFVGIDRFLEQGSLWKLMGGPPTGMAIHTFVPDHPSLVRSINLDPSAGWTWIRQIVGTLGGDAVLGELDAGLRQGEEASGIHLQAVLDSLGTSFQLAVYLDPEHSLNVPMGPKPFEMPAPSVLMAIQVNDRTVPDILTNQLASVGMVLQPQDVNGAQTLQIPEPLPAPIPLQPAMALQDGFLLIASTPDLLKRALAARGGQDRFQDGETYARMFGGMSPAMNGLAYVGPQISDLIVDLQMASIEAEMADQPEGFGVAMREWMGLFAEAEGAAVQVNLPDGILMEMTSTTSGRDQIGTLLTVVPAAIVAAVTVPAFSQARDAATGVACQSNLKMIGIAKQAWALDNGLEEGMMAGPDGLLPYLPNGLPVCPQGGAYTLGPIGTPPGCSVHGASGE